MKRPDATSQARIPLFRNAKRRHLSPFARRAVMTGPIAHQHQQPGEPDHEPLCEHVPIGPPRSVERGH